MPCRVSLLSAGCLSVWLAGCLPCLCLCLPVFWLAFVRLCVVRWSVSWLLPWLCLCRLCLCPASASVSVPAPVSVCLSLGWPLLGFVLCFGRSPGLRPVSVVPVSALPLSLSLSLPLSLSACLSALCCALVGRLALALALSLPCLCLCPASPSVSVPAPASVCLFGLCPALCGASACLLCCGVLALLALSCCRCVVLFVLPRVAGCRVRTPRFPSLCCGHFAQLGRLGRVVFPKGPQG